MDKFNWDDLKYILAVAKAGSVNAAAQSLGKNHATILRRIASFENAHGISVFQKNAKGYIVTPDARPIIEALQGVEASVETTERVIAGKGEALNGKVRVTSTDSLCRSILPPIIKDFLDLHPKISLDLVATNSRLNMAKLDAEMTVRPSSTLPQDLVGNKANKMHFGVFATASYIRKNNSGDIRKHKWLTTSGAASRSPVGRWQETIPIENIAFTSDSFISLADLAETGLGVAVLPISVGRMSQNLIQLDQFELGFDTDVWVAAHKDLFDTPRISELVDFFTNAIATLEL